MKITRRKLLGLAVVPTVALYCGEWWWSNLYKKDPTRAIVYLVKKRLHYLDLDPEGVELFAEDFYKAGRQTREFGPKRMEGDDSFRLQAVDLVRPLYALIPLPRAMRGFYALHYLEKKLEIAYLTASDFFLNGADEKRVVKYLGLGTLLQPCGSPFARFD